MTRMKLAWMLLFPVLFIAAGCGGSGTNVKPDETIENTVIEDVLDEVEVVEDNSGLFVEEGQFKISFFGETDITPETLAGENDRQKVVYNLEKSDTELYSVSYTEYPTEVIEQTEHSELFDQVKSSYGEVTNEEEIGLGDYSGYSFRADDGEVFTIVYLYIAGSRLYELSILSVGQYAEGDELNEFVESFDIIGI